MCYVVKEFGFKWIVVLYLNIDWGCISKDIFVKVVVGFGV